MVSPGTWESLCLTSEWIASGTGLERNPAEAGVFPAEEGTARTNPLERGSESISDLVFGTGSRSASLVLLTLGRMQSQVHPLGLTIKPDACQRTRNE
jgi:hypothetical protein